MTREERRLFIKQVYLEDMMRIPNEKHEALRDLQASEAWGRLLEVAWSQFHTLVSSLSQPMSLFHSGRLNDTDCVHMGTVGGRHVRSGKHLSSVTPFQQGLVWPQSWATVRDSSGLFQREREMGTVLDERHQRHALPKTALGKNGDHLGHRKRKF